MQRFIAFVVVALFGSYFSEPVRAEWALPNLNPWSSSAPTSKPVRSTSKPATSSSSWLPSWGGSSPPRSNRTGVLTKMQNGMSQVSNGTRNMVQKTTQTLTPWRNTPAPSNIPPTGSRGKITKTSSKSKQSSWLPNLSPWPEEEKERDNSVNGFLGQKKPGFHD